MGNRHSRQPSRPTRPPFHFDFNDEIETNFRSIHRRLVCTDNLVKELEASVHQLHYTIEYMKSDLVKFRKLQRRALRSTEQSLSDKGLDVASGVINDIDCGDRSDVV